MWTWIKRRTKKTKRETPSAQDSHSAAKQHWPEDNAPANAAVGAAVGGGTGAVLGGLAGGVLGELEDDDGSY